MEVFYAENIKQITTLSPEESRHCIRATRHRRGDIINLIDGTGIFYTAKIVDDNPKAAVVEIVDKKTGFGLVPYSLTVALPPLKKAERYEWFVEKVTEIGVAAIQPVVTHYTEKNNLRIDRLKRIIISAAKQSLHTKFPEILPVIKFDQLVSMNFKQKLIALCNEKNKLIDVYQTGASAVLLVGPEGGFTSDEISKALNNGFIPVSLGQSRLRAETAAVFGTSIIAHKNF